MAKTDNLTDFFKDLADAIREKTGETELINAQDFSEKIKNIQSGDSTDLDFIKYEDDMDNFRTGKKIPTDEEYETILARGYALLDEIFGKEQ